MAQCGDTSDEAFDRLIAMSQAQNVKLREVARELIETANGSAAADESGAIAS